MKFTSILLPFDGSEHSFSAAKYALGLASLFKAKITVIHCYDWPGNIVEISDELLHQMKENHKRESENRLMEAEQILKGQGVEYDLQSVAGSPGFELIERAKSGDFDLIIMGSHGHSELAGLFLGSVTHKVLNRIYCPIMVVP